MGWLDDKKNIYIVGLFCVIIIFCLYLYSFRGIESRVDEVGQHIQSATEQLGEARQTITDSKREINTIRSNNNEARESINESRDINKSNAELIAEGKRILREIRERN
jgi:peptidoglycan hydrolase CwlO-like protein